MNKDIHLKTVESNSSDSEKVSPMDLSTAVVANKINAIITQKEKAFLILQKPVNNIIAIKKNAQKRGLPALN